MSDVRSYREALVTELLGDADKLLTRAESIESRLAERENSISDISRSLDSATDRFRLAVTGFTDEARQTLIEFVERKASEVTARTVEEQRLLLQQAAQSAFNTHVAADATKLALTLNAAAKKLESSRIQRFCELLVTALFTAASTAAFIHWMN